MNAVIEIAAWDVLLYRIESEWFKKLLLEYTPRVSNTFAF